MGFKGLIFSLILLMFLSESEGTSQIQARYYAETGMNNVSDGTFIKNAAFVDYTYKHYKMEAGSQLNILSPVENLFTGFSLSGFAEVMIKQVPLEFGAFVMVVPYSGIFNETNWGITAHYRSTHFESLIGTSFRTYGLTKKVVKEEGLQEHTKLHENRNLLYLVRYYLKPMDHPWNAGIALTNMDHFVINQETNPVMNINALYQISQPVNLFSEVWYQSAGAFNLNVNPFGFIVRIGLIWHIN